LWVEIRNIQTSLQVDHTQKIHPRYLTESGNDPPSGEDRLTLPRDTQ
jgi:hypothetical protein